MEKRKCLTFLFCLILCYSLFQYITRAQSSSQATIFSQGAITYSPSNANLAVIPDDWSLIFGSYPQYAYLDYSVTHSDHVSIRVEPGYPREVNGIWYPTEAGDHIIASCWMRTDNLTGYVHDPSNADLWKGARIGIDLYGPKGDGTITILDSFPHDVQEAHDSYVEWNTPNWTQKSWDIIVPSTIFTTDRLGNTIPPTQITQIVMWMQVVMPTDIANAWFADAELYINP